VRPVNREGVRRETFAGLRLSTQIGVRRTQQIDTEIPCCRHKQPGIEVARVDDVLTRKQVLAPERVVGWRCDVTVCNRAGRRLHMCDDPGQAVVAGFAQVCLVIDPGPGVLARVMGTGVVGRADERPRRWDPIVLRAPSHPVVVEIELLHLDAAQHFHRRKLGEPVRSSCRVGSSKQMMSVLSDRPNPGVSLGGRPWEAIIKPASLVCNSSVRQSAHRQPFGSSQGQHLQGVPIVSWTHSARFMARTAARTWVEPMRCRPPALSN